MGWRAGVRVQNQGKMKHALKHADALRQWLSHQLALPRAAYGLGHSALMADTDGLGHQALWLSLMGLVTQP